MTPHLLFVATIASDAAAVLAPLAKTPELPEVASMTLLAVVFSGASVILRRADGRQHGRDRRPSGS